MKIIATIVVLSLAAVSPAALGDGRDAGNFELTFGPTYGYSESYTGLTGSSLSLDSAIGLQFGVDYFLSNRLSVGFDMGWSRPDYDAVLVPEDGSEPQTVSHSARLFNGQFNGAYYFVHGPLAPFVELNAGWTYLDSNIASEPPLVGCWWDPWWGYICDGFYNTYDDTKFSYGGALGVRWDFSPTGFVKGAYRTLEIEADNLRADPTMDQLSLEFGWRF